MAMEYTEEQLNNFDKATLVQLFLAQQSQLRDIDQKLQLLLEQVAVLNNNRFGRSSEKLETENQISFLEVDGNIIYFNEAEAVESLAEYEEDETTIKGITTDKGYEILLSEIYSGTTTETKTLLADKVNVGGSFII